MDEEEKCSYININVKDNTTTGSDYDSMDDPYQ